MASPVVVVGGVVVVVAACVVEVVDEMEVVVVVAAVPPPQAAVSKAIVAIRAGMTLLILIRRTRSRYWVTESFVFLCGPILAQDMATKRLTKHIATPPRRGNAVLTDPESVEHWIVPDGMSSQVHDFDAREGGTFRISLTYDDPD